GSTKKQASYKGRDIMDYQRSGTATKDLNRIFGFLNPNLQGKSKQLRALKERPISTSIKTLTTGMSLSYLAKWATDNFSSDIQRERIADAPEWLKQTYWLIPGADDEKVIRIPKPYEVSVLASTPTEYMLNRADEANSDFEASLGEWLKQAIFIDPSLNIATPAWEAYTGHDTFTGQDIIPTSDQGLPATEQGDVHTSSIAKGATNLLSKAGLDVSPWTIDHLVGGYAPISGENASDVIDRLLEVSGQRENVKPKGSTGVENLNPFVMDVSQRYSPLIGDAHESTDKLQSMKRQTQESGEAFPYHNAYAANRGISSRDSELAKIIRQIDNDPNLSREEKS